MNRGGVDEPWPVHLSGQPACLNRRIAIGPPLRLRRGVRLQHEDATERGVIHERSGNYKFMFGGQLTDIGHVRFLKLFTGFFAQLWSVGGTIQQYEEVLLGARVRRGLCRRGRRACKRDQAEQK